MSWRESIRNWSYRHWRAIDVGSMVAGVVAVLGLLGFGGYWVFIQYQTRANWTVQGPILVSQTVEGILGSHREAIGGGEAWMQTNSILKNGVEKRDGVHFSISAQIKRPNLLKITLRSNAGTIFFGYDGKTGWMGTQLLHQPPDYVQLTGDVLANVAMNASVDPPLLEAIRNNATFRQLPPARVRGSLCYALEETNPRGLEKRCFYIQAQTFLVIKIESRYPLAGHAIQVEEFFADYRSVGPLKIPFREQTWVDGKQSIDTRFEKVFRNPGFGHGSFQYPQTPASQPATGPVY